MLHLAIKSGTDLALFNALFTEIAAKGWVDRGFIAASTTGSTRRSARTTRRSNRRRRSPASRPTTSASAAAWIAEPKAGGARRRTMFAYEKGLIWGNDNYRTNQALVNIALATGNLGRPGGGCVRMGGHQEGYVRPPEPTPRPAVYVDQLLIGGGGGVHHIWGCDHFKTTLNASEFKRVYKRRTDLVKAAIDAVPAGDRAAMVEAIMGAIRQGGLFSVDVDIVPTQIGTCAHVMLPAATAGEANLTSMNGERRMRLTERYMDPPGRSLPDSLIVAKLAQALEASWRAAGKPETADKFKGYDWKTEEDAFMDGYHKNAGGGAFVTYERLRAMGTNGFQEPAVGFENGKIVGTKRLFTDGKFNVRRTGGRSSPRRRGAGSRPRARRRRRRSSASSSTTAGRTRCGSRCIWTRTTRSSMTASRCRICRCIRPTWPNLGSRQGDLAEVYNDNGSTQAMVWPTPTRAAQRDVHAVRLPHRRCRQRRQQGRERAGDPELQADLGQYPQARRCPEIRRRALVQERGVPAAGLSAGALGSSQTTPRATASIAAEPHRQAAMPPAPASTPESTMPSSRPAALAA